MDGDLYQEKSSKKKEDILSKCRWRMRESEVSPDHFSLKIFGYGLSTMTSKGTEVSAEGNEDLQVSSGECSTSFERFMFVKLP